MPETDDEVIMATFDGVRSRFWGYVGGQLQTFGGFATGTMRPGLDSSRRDKYSEYGTRWTYYENKRLYYTLKAAGVREIAMPTEWNPVPATVAFYTANTLGGSPALVVDDDIATGDALREAIAQVWVWSNWAVLQRELVETAAVLSDTFVKVAERQDDGDTEADGETTAVYMQNIPPETVRWWEADERGYLTAIRIDTPRLTSVFTGKEYRHTLTEVWRKEWPGAKEGEPSQPGGVRFYETLPGQPVDDKQLSEPVREQTFIELGYDFIPIVWMESPTYWWQLTDQIDRYNGMAMKIDRINRALGTFESNMFSSEGRPMNLSINTNEIEMTYQESAAGEAGWLRLPGSAKFQWAGNPIDFATARAQMLDIRDGVVSSLPEYRVATLDATQIATETLQMLLSQAGQRALELRDILERGLVRAHMMAISIARVAGLEGFDAATVGEWDAGTLEHTFAERDVFETPLAIKAAQLKELVAAGMPLKLAMAEAGFSEERIAEYDSAAAEDALRQRTTLAAQLVRQQALVDSGAADNGVTQL